MIGFFNIFVICRDSYFLHTHENKEKILQLKEEVLTESFKIPAPGLQKNANCCETSNKVMRIGSTSL